MSEGRRLGSLLVQAKLLSREKLEAALVEQAVSGEMLGRILVDKGLVAETDLVSVLAAQVGYEFVDLSEYRVDPAAPTIVSESLARRYGVLPVGWDGDRLVVAMADPSNVFALDDVRTLAKQEVKVVVATRASILEAIGRYHRIGEGAEDISALAADEPLEEDLTNLTAATDEAPIVRLLNMLIVQAVEDRASDIHIEPTERDVRIRYRIDGVLHEVMRPPKSAQAGIVSRLKIMANMDIADRRVPQDGRVNVNLKGSDIDLRVATLPTVYGEKVVMRILDKSKSVLKLSELGFLDASMERFEASYRKPSGTILVTGPTGSGKSTTLYATLNIVSDETRNVITVEDPVEYRLPGINQVQVNKKAGLTFAAALRSILRCDPDVVLVGEIRDRETATIAVEAALTGHLVLSTLHTNDAASTPTRLVEMGVEPYLAATAVDCIVAQRLARRLCPRCKQAYQPSASELHRVGLDPEAPGGAGQLFRPVGCGSCGKTGYRGRFAIHEVLTVSEEVERLIVARSHSEEVKKVAVAQGMITLRQAGHYQAAQGLTSLAEILRVVD
ncbi:MAG TPA: ATPase, T2SS/T4P/T4SS family [Acidimicrobiales bacterium]|nr:ATPase, T2SS/T4P/T4SS family [Acidimicrobiales bacterium]